MLSKRIRKKSQLELDPLYWGNIADKVAKLEAVVNRVKWLNLNIHNYGTEQWKQYFEALVGSLEALEE